MDEKEKTGGGRTRQLSEGSDGSELKRTRSSDEPIDSSSGPYGRPESPLPSTADVAASPPRFVNMDKLVETVRQEAERMRLAHEIAVNADFKLEQRKDLPGGTNSAYAAIHQNMLKAYWDIIQEDICKDPPVLDMVLKLCADIRQMLLELLLPHQNAMRGKIEDLFDIDLVKQRCEQAKSIEPLREHGPAVLDAMQQLCCPMRDEEIQALRQIDDTIQLFQGIIRVLEEMKLDFANFLIKQIRPLVKETIQDYEKEKMREIEGAQKVLGVEDPLVNTKAWLQRAFNDLYSVNHQKPSGGATLLQGYMQLVFQNQYLNEEWELPESLLLDRDRILKLQQAYIIVTIASAVIIITQSYVPSALVASAEFKRRLKEACIAVLKDVQCTCESDVRDALQDLANKIVQDVQRETNGLALADGREALVHGQLTELANVDHPVRNVVYGRVVAFVTAMVKAGGGKDVKVPPGLSALETELTKLAADFIQIISLNRATHAEKYNAILTDIYDAKIVN
ncbi:T-complex protein 11-like protein 1 isoform X2 [Varroa jacobsoni]|nr:T-complex protein 11-like protein 1 isoform X2 [Varroa destructor]XP_022669980.1 T-complex protein 11-like protein 1 isoform X2 [Varroa destructor]XP_022687135.1 T-complex protein 11-like protein 1 isoform X2 [Varroa jacobsoni]